MVGVFYNTFLPGSVGGDLLKAYFIAKEHPERKARAIATVIADRALGLFGLILFVAVLGSLAWAGGDERIIANPDLQWLIKLMAGIAGGSILGFLLWATCRNGASSASRGGSGGSPRSAGRWPSSGSRW